MKLPFQKGWVPQVAVLRDLCCATFHEHRSRSTATCGTHALIHVIVVSLVALAGCGYKNSAGGYDWKPLYRPDVRTVAVPIFTTKSFDRNVEFQLTKALVNTIEAKTPYKVVPRERADTILEGEIKEVTRRNISSDNRSGVPQEQLYEVVVNFTWKDLRSGKLLVNRENFEQTVPFYPTLGESQFIGSQQNVERLAQGIVQEMQGDW